MYKKQIFFTKSIIKVGDSATYNSLIGLAQCCEQREVCLLFLTTGHDCMSQKYAA